MSLKSTHLESALGTRKVIRELAFAVGSAPGGWFRLKAVTP